MENKVYDLIVVGGGPAGATAAIFAGRSNFSVLVLEKKEIGALLSAHKIDDYSGFPEGIKGKDLYEDMKKQAQRFGAEFIEDTFLELDIYSSPKVVKATNGAYQGKTIVLATGSPKNLGKKLKGEKEFLGNGVSYCATCDGFFTKGRTVALFGNGHELAEEALFLTQHAKEVLVVVEEEDLLVEGALRESLLSNEKVKLITGTKLIEIMGTDYVEKVKVLQNGEEKEIETEITFLYLGTKSTADLYQGFANLNPEGYIITGEDMACNVEGVWAAGDLRAKTYKKVATAVADGTVAGIEVIKYMMINKK